MQDAPQTLIERVIAHHDQRQDFITDTDGYVYFHMNGTGRGHLASVHLRIIADELDRRNAAWDVQVKAALAKP